MTKFASATPVLRCRDYAAARDFYVDVLGFRVTEEGGQPPRFGIVERDRAVLFLNGWVSPAAEHPGGWDAYLHVDDVGLLRDALLTAGAQVLSEVRKTVYGMLEFEIRDPDGNILCFGEDTDPTSSR